MKIAILTQPLKSNYGGILQAFALQQVLKDLGHDVTTIDRQPDARSRARQLLSLLKSFTLQFTTNNKPFCLSKNQHDIIFQNPLNFIRRNISISPPINSTKEMQQHFSERDYDVVVVGSDQTWRPAYSPNILNFYLDFLNNKKITRIAYASSFGVDTWEYNKHQTLKCRELISKFDAISVRENSGINLCKKYLHAPADIVLDPTLLLSADDYLNRLNIDTDNKRTNSLFTYTLDNNPDKDNAIAKTSEKLGLTAFTNQPAYNIFRGGSPRLDDYIYPKVEDWIKSIHDAEFVLTDSFHGCAFSIIFNKPFLAIGNQDRGMTRFNSLLNTFKLEHRLITNSSQITLDNISCDIDWPKINAILEEKKSHSLKFIQNSIGTKAWKTP